jgi:hypothetical protein
MQSQAPDSGFARLSSAASIGGMPINFPNQMNAAIERLASGGAQFSPITDKLAASSVADQFSRLQSLPHMVAAQGVAQFGRTPSGVNGAVAEAFTRAASSMMPFAGPIDRVSSLTSVSQMGEQQTGGHDGAVPSFRAAVLVVHYVYVTILEPIFLSSWTSLSGIISI